MPRDQQKNYVNSTRVSQNFWWSFSWNFKSNPWVYQNDFSTYSCSVHQICIKEYKTRIK